MKKSLVVLLIAVLALSAVFAADVAITVEGDVSASYVVDFDDGITGTYNVPELNGALAWELVLPVAKAGSEYPYIDVAGEIEVDLADVAYYLAPEVDFSTFAIVGEDWKVDFLASIGTLDYAVSAIDKGWYIPTNAYKNTTTGYGFITGRAVSSPLTYRWQSAAYYNDAVAVSKDGVGTLTFVGTTAKAVDYDETKTGSACYAATEVVAVFENRNDAENYQGKLSVASSSNPLVSYTLVEDTVKGLWKVVKNTAYTPASTVFAVEGESAELKLADSITTQFGFGFAKKTVEYSAAAKASSYANYCTSKALNSMNAGFSTKSSYEDILTVAADFGYDFVKKYYDEAAKKAIPQFSFDVASAFKYEMVSVDVYYAYGPLSFYNGEDLYAINSYYQYYTNYLKSGDSVYKAFDETGVVVGSAYPVYSLLSAKAAVEVEEIGTTFTFTGKDLLDDVSLAYEAVNTYFDNYTFTFGVEAVDNEDAEHIVVDSVSFLAEADYTEEVGVTAYAGVTAYYSYTHNDGNFFPVFETGFAYDKNGFSFSVDFSSLREINENGISGTRAKYADLEKTFKNTAFTVKTGYEAEMFTINGTVEFNTHEKSAKSYRPWSLCQGLYVSAGIESDKLVDGATLSLDYESGRLDKSTPSYGSVTAAVTVEF